MLIFFMLKVMFMLLLMSGCGMTEGECPVPIKVAKYCLVDQEKTGVFQENTSTFVSTD